MSYIGNERKLKKAQKPQKWNDKKRGLIDREILKENSAEQSDKNFRSIGKTAQ